MGHINGRQVANGTRWVNVFWISYHVLSKLTMVW